MTKRSIAAQLCAGLEGLGFTKLGHNSKRFVVYHRPGVLEDYLYVGKLGALRRGRTIAESVMVSPAMRKQVLEAAPP